jgi:hypothetical protein
MNTPSIQDLQMALDASLAQGAILTEIVSNKKNYKLKSNELDAVINPNNAFSQPVPPYDAVYPYNNAQTTPSGHVFELDDTPGSERINIAHRTGTFQEIGPDGSMTEKVMNNNFKVVVQDNSIYILGDSQETIQGDVKIYVQGDAKIQVDGDVEWEVGGNMLMKVGGIFTAQATSFNFIGPVNHIGDLSTTGNILTQSNVVANQNMVAKIDLVVGRNASVAVNTSVGSAVTVGTTVTSGGDMIANKISLDKHTHPDAQGGNTGAPNTA